MPHQTQQPHAHVARTACALHVTRMPRHASHTTTKNPSRPKRRPPPNDSITARKEDNDRQPSAKRMTANAQQGRQRQPRPERRPAATSGNDRRAHAPRTMNDPTGTRDHVAFGDGATKQAGSRGMTTTTTTLSSSSFYILQGKHAVPPLPQCLPFPVPPSLSAIPFLPP